MGRNSDTSRQQLGARRGDHEARVLAFDREFDFVKRARQLAILDFRLGHRALKVRVPHRRCVGGIDMPLLP